MINKFKHPSNQKISSLQNSPRNSETESVYSERSYSSKRGSKLENIECTTLYSGELRRKNDKILALLGTLEEMISFTGIIKSESLDPNLESKLEIDNSLKIFFYARLTQIQETLIDIQYCLGTTKKNIAKFEFNRFNGELKIKELENEINLMGDVDFTSLKKGIKDKPLQIIPGSSLLESRLLFLRALCRKAERQTCLMKSVFDFNVVYYLNKLGDYLLALSIHILHIQNKEPLKKAFKNTIRKN